MKYNIVLIGAMGVGKTTIANAFKEQQESISIYETDIEKHNFLAGSKFDRSRYEKILSEENWYSAFDYTRSFLTPEHLERMLDEAGEFEIINIGADLIDWSFQEDFEKCQLYLAEYTNVIFLNYSDDFEENCCELSLRIINRPNDVSENVLNQQAKYNFRYLKSNLFSNIAKHVIYTKGKEIDTIVEEIATIFNGSIPIQDN